MLRGKELMRTQRKIWTEAEAFADIPDLKHWSEEELDGFAAQCARQQFDDDLVSCTAKLRTPLASVWLANGSNNGVPESVWIVGGEVPFCELNTELCRNEFDALGIFAWFLRLWHEKMLNKKQGDLPNYKEPPLMQPLQYDPANDIKLSRMRSFLLYRTMNKFVAQVENEEVRQRLYVVGVGSKPLS